MWELIEVTVDGARGGKDDAFDVRVFGGVEEVEGACDVGVMGIERVGEGAWDAAEGGLVEDEIGGGAEVLEEWGVIEIGVEEFEI